MNTPARLLAFLLFLASAISGIAQETAVGKCKASPLRDIGEYNDIFILENEDFVILRKGDTLYSLAMDETATPVKLVSDPSLKYTGINEGIKIHDRLWLLIVSEDETPFIIDAYSGLKKELEIPGSWHTWKTTRVTGQAIIIPELDTMILQLAREPWLKGIGEADYLCVRLNLKTGELSSVLEDWLLCYFTTDMRTAFFDSPTQCLYASVDLVTGKTVEDLESLPEIPLAHVCGMHIRIIKTRFAMRYFNGYKEEIMPVYAVPRTYDPIYEGIVINGRFISIKGKTDKISTQNNISLNDDYLAFTENRYSETFLITPVTEKGLEKITAQCYGRPVFLLLGHGSCVFINRVKKNLPKNDEAFFKAYGSAPWNILSGFDASPEKDVTKPGNVSEILSIKNAIWTDRMSISLYRSFGSHESQRLVLCNFVEPPNIRLGSMLIDSSGRRFWAHAPETGGHIELIIHDSGNVVVQNYISSRDKDDKENHFLIRTLKLTPEIK